MFEDFDRESRRPPRIGRPGRAIRVGGRAGNGSDRDLPSDRQENEERTEAENGRCSEIRSEEVEQVAETNEPTANPRGFRGSAGRDPWSRLDAIDP